MKPPLAPRPTLVLGLLFLATPGASAAQERDSLAAGIVLRGITLDEAIEETMSQNAALRVAEARHEITRADGRTTGSALWPQLSIGTAYTRSVDPVFTFGTKLRRSRFGPDDFDLARLNDPDPLGDWVGTVDVNWSVADPGAWARRSGARQRARAADWSTRRTREVLLLETRVLYYRALRAEGRLEAALQAESAAAAHLQLFQRRADRGLLTRADVLQSQAELAAAEAQRVEAERARHEARRHLGTHLGWDPRTLPVPEDSLPEPSPPDESRFDPGARADIRALAATVEAARAQGREATAAFLPTLDAFAQFRTHSGEILSSDASDWTVGLAFRWPLFLGFGRVARVDRARLQQRIAETEYTQAVREARAEVDLAERAVVSARKRFEASRDAARAAEAGRDLTRRRLDEGLATAADLLQAEARAAAMRERAIDALAAYHIAVARLEFVRSQPDREETR